MWQHVFRIPHVTAPFQRQSYGPKYRTRGTRRMRLSQLVSAANGGLYHDAWAKLDSSDHDPNPDPHPNPQYAPVATADSACTAARISDAICADTALEFQGFFGKAPAKTT